MIVCQEVKNYKKEWKVVMDKLENVGNILLEVGTFCQRHGLKKEQLPSGLLDALEPFQRCLFPFVKICRGLI
jgi:hypothetical protein